MAFADFRLDFSQILVTNHEQKSRFRSLSRALGNRYHFTKSDERKRDFSSRFATEFFQFVFTQRALWIGCLTFWWSKPVDRFVISKLSSVSGGKHLLIKISSRCCSLLGIWSSYRLWSRNLVSLARSSCSSKSPLGAVFYWGFGQVLKTLFVFRDSDKIPAIPKEVSETRLTNRSKCLESLPVVVFLIRHTECRKNTRKDWKKLIAQGAIARALSSLDWRMLWP